MSIALIDKFFCHEYVPIMDSVQTVIDPEVAALLMHPLRRRIVEEAQHPTSASEIARRIGEKRQKVNYRVTELAEAGLLVPAGERNRRNMTEKLYRASSSSYAIDSRTLGKLAPNPESMSDGLAAGTLLALADQATTEIGLSLRQARAAGKRLATTAIEAELRFTSAQQKAEFAEALSQAIADVVVRHSHPATSRKGHRYRFIAGAYPIPKKRREKQNERFTPSRTSS